MYEICLLKWGQYFCFGIYHLHIVVYFILHILTNHKQGRIWLWYLQSLDQYFMASVVYWFDFHPRTQRCRVRFLVGKILKIKSLFVSKSAPELVLRCIFPITHLLSCFLREHNGLCVFVKYCNCMILGVFLCAKR